MGHDGEPLTSVCVLCMVPWWPVHGPGVSGRVPSPPNSCPGTQALLEAAAPGLPVLLCEQHTEIVCDRLFLSNKCHGKSILQLHAHNHTQTQTQKNTRIHTDGYTHTDTQTHRHTDRHRYVHTHTAQQEHLTTFCFIRLISAVISEVTHSVAFNAHRVVAGEHNLRT
jgi:hypothetical protein